MQTAGMRTGSHRTHLLERQSLWRVDKDPLQEYLETQMLELLKKDTGDTKTNHQESLLLESMAEP